MELDDDDTPRSNVLAPSSRDNPYARQLASGPEPAFLVEAKSSGQILKIERHEYGEAADANPDCPRSLEICWRSSLVRARAANIIAGSKSSNSARSAFVHCPALFL